MDNQVYAVLTGDIVESTRLSVGTREDLYNKIKDLSASVMNQYQDAVKYMPATFSGDSWQILVNRPEMALRVALYFRASIIAGSPDDRIDTRVSIGIGKVDYIPDNDISGGDGEAYRLSGKSLNLKKRPERMILEFPKWMESDTTEALKMVVKLIDLLVSDWTVPQARAVCGAMFEWTQQRIARKWPEREITQQAVGQHLDKARWEYVLESIDLFEKAISGVLHLT